MYRYQEDLFAEAAFPEGIDKNDVVQAILFEGRDLPLVYPDADYMRPAIGWWARTNAYTFLGWLKSTQAQYDPIENYNRYEWSKDDGTRDAVSDRVQTRNLVDEKTQTRDLTDNINRNREVSDDNTRTVNLSDETTGSTNSADGGKDVGKRTDDLEAVTSRTGFNSGTLVAAEKVDNNGTQTNENTYGKTTDIDVSETVDHTGTDKNQRTLQETNTDTITYGGTDSHLDRYTGTDSHLDKDNETSVNEHTAHLHGNIGVTTTQQMLAEEREIVVFNVCRMIAKHFVDTFCMGVY